MTVAAILAATALATLAAVRSERDDADRARAEVVGPVARGLGAELDSASASVGALRAVLEASPQLSPLTFRHVAASPLARQPWLTALAWVPGARASPVAAGDGPAGFLAAREVGRPTSAAGTLDPAPAARAAREARDSAAVRLSAPLDGATGREVVLVAPVYAPAAPLGRVALRRAALRGFVTGSLDLDALTAGVRGLIPAGAHLRVADGDRPLVGDRPPSGDGAVAIDATGRRWTVALQGLAGASAAFPASLAAGGMLLAAVVGLLFAESSRRERDALRTAAASSAESRATRSELERLQVRHELILESAGDGIVGVDREGRATFVNPAAGRMLRRDPVELRGASAAELGLPWLPAALAGGSTRSGEMELARGDGSIFTAEHATTPILEGSETIGAVVTFRDVTARRRVEDQRRQSLAAAEQRAAVDPLTGLANHRTFHERLRTEVQVARRRRHGLALVLMDLDHFKRVNDVHGHQVGDRVLQHAARVLAAETRAGELVARVGGEEFAMILPEADAEEALRAAERVRRGIAAADFPAVGHMTMSAGVCDLTEAADADALYRLADGALYWAKHHGRDVVMRYSPEVTRALSAQEQAERLERQQAMVSIRLLARVVDAKDPSTRRHSERVAELCEEIADALGWSPERCRLLGDAGLVHDVGKIGVPDAILFKPGRLSPDEYEAVKEHAELGARIVAEALTTEQTSWVRSHHERWGGGGYPAGLVAEDIPEGARIMALADAWDVMTTERPYTAVPSTPGHAIDECRAAAGEQFWPAAVQALVTIRGAGA